MSQVRYAFFDVDGTLVNIKTMMNFMRFYRMYCAKWSWFGVLQYYKFRAKLRIAEKFGIPRETLNTMYYEAFKGVSPKVINRIAQLWYRFERRYNTRLYKNEVVARLRHHQCEGVQTVFVSGSFSACLEGIAKDFGVETILATELEVDSGRYTGKILQQTIGAGKSQVIHDFLAKVHCNHTRDCFAYGDHISDLPMLKCVGHPVVVSGDEALERYARQSDWQIIAA